MQNHKTTSKAIYQAIDKAKNIILVSHRSPDGDTLGANLAMVSYLKKLSKNVTSFCVDPVPDYLQFLPNQELITDDHKVWLNEYDLIIALDSSNLQLAGIENLLTALPNKPTLMNIDHHVSNPLYGDINLVLVDASSTAEVIHRLFNDWGVVIDNDIATSLATGIVTDTGGLKNPSTGYRSISAVSDLIAQGANINNIAQKTINQIHVNKLKLWGRALERLTKVTRYNIVYTWIRQSDLEECETDETASEGLSNFLHILNEGKVIMVLKEAQDGVVRGSLRTSSEIDLTKLAGVFGGGGHRKAAGFSLPGRLVYDNNKLRIE